MIIAAAVRMIVQRTGFFSANHQPNALIHSPPFFGIVNRKSSFSFTADMKLKNVMEFCWRFFSIPSTASFTSQIFWMMRSATCDCCSRQAL